MLHPHPPKSPCRQQLHLWMSRYTVQLCFYRELALRPPQTFEKASEFLSGQLSQRWIHKAQFWHPPLKFESRRQIPTKWRRRCTPPPVALQGVATPPSRFFPQFRVCRRGVAATPPPKGHVAPHLGPPCGVLRVVWTSETLSRSRVWSSYTCECRATLRH